MEIKPIAYFRSPLKDKFGIPRQAGLAGSLRGEIVFEPEYSSAEAVRGLEGFDYIWLIWGFSLNPAPGKSLTVRPPRLGGNERIGVFASRSPFRPNQLGLSSVRMERIEKGRICVLGADLADMTPIYDIKPYVEYCDSHPGVRSGFVDSNIWTELEVRMPEDGAGLAEPDMKALAEILKQDPRPQYADDSDKIYGLSFRGMNVRFRVEGNRLTVLDILNAQPL